MIIEISAQDNSEMLPLGSDSWKVAGKSWRDCDEGRRGTVDCMTLRNSRSSLRVMQEQSVSNCPMKENFYA